MMTDSLEKEVRRLRVCDVCGGVDDHPRHDHNAAPGEFDPPSKEVVDKVLANAAKLKTDVEPLLRDLYERSVQLRHMDCCRAVGCPTGECNDVPDLRGMELVRAIVGESK